MFPQSRFVRVKTKQASKDNIGNALKLDWSKIKGPILLHFLVPLIFKTLWKSENMLTKGKVMKKRDL
jgi:hypothetical protein